MNGQNMTYLIFVTCTLWSIFVLGVATEFDSSALLVDHYPQVFYFTWAELELFNHYLCTFHQYAANDTHSFKLQANKQ